eukprot:1313439-Rhodomonas_salina.1
MEAKKTDATRISAPSLELTSPGPAEMSATRTQAEPIEMEAVNEEPKIETHAQLSEWLLEVIESKQLSATEIQGMISPNISGQHPKPSQDSGLKSQMADMVKKGG